MHKIIFFPENLKKFLGFSSKFRKVQVTLNTGIFFLFNLAILVRAHRTKPILKLGREIVFL